jgi:hypothetical protein
LFQTENKLRKRSSVNISGHFVLVIECKPLARAKFISFIMAEAEKQEGKKTVVAFIVGLLIGGLLVWTFSPPVADAPEAPREAEGEPAAEVGGEGVGAVNGEGAAAAPVDALAPTATPQLQIGEGSVVVEDQPAGWRVALRSAVYPINEGWIGVRDYQNGQLGTLLGVVRFSEGQGLVPSEIILQRATTPGKQYAVVMYNDDGDRQFSLATDVQIDSIFATFTAR